MSKTINTKIVLRNDTSTNWNTNNPTLAKGQIGIETDTRKFKFGDGITPWTALNYAVSGDINVIESVQKNGQALPITNKTVNIEVPTKTSDILNDSGFITSGDIPEGSAASTTIPLMDGTAATGTELAFARGDHRHPSDTTKVDKETGKGLSTNDYTTAEKNKLNGIETGAQVNVKANWTATSGDGEILNKPTTLAGYGITDAMTATAIEQAINTALTSAFKYKGVKATVSELPTTGNTTGDIWHVTENGAEYVWNGSSWEELGTTIDLSDYLQSVSVAGITLTPSSYTITVAQLKTQLGLAAAAYKQVDSTIASGSSSTNLPTVAAVVSYVASASTKTQASATNGNIKINNIETTVYTLPSTTLDSNDTLILNCGSSTTNYS